MVKKNLTIKEIFALAIQNHQKNNLKVTENLYKEILKINPSHVYAHNNLGIVLKELGEDQKAISSFQKAIEIQPNYIDAYYNLGIVLRELGEHQRAIKCCQKAIEIQPNYEGAYYNLGIVFNELGEDQKAISSFQKAIQIEPNKVNAYNGLGNVLRKIGEYQKAITYFKKALTLKPDSVLAQRLIANIYISQLDDLEKAISESHKTLKIHLKISKFIDHKISITRLKHDVQQAEYLSSKNYKINGINKFQKIGNEILGRKENREDTSNSNKKILLNDDEVKSLLPFYKANHIYQTSEIFKSCINPHINWHEIEEQYFNSPKQIICIDNFLSDEAIKELREFCLVSKIWHDERKNKNLSAMSDKGFISPIHLQIAIDLKQKLPKLFGSQRLWRYWAFKYDTTLGKGLNIHSDGGLLNLNFWITPEEYNNNKNSGGLKVYDIPAPIDWPFAKYNLNIDAIYKFLNDNNANCTTIPYKFNRAVLFNSDYFHKTDNINFKEGYEARRINITYLFGDRLVAKRNS